VKVVKGTFFMAHGACSLQPREKPLSRAAVKQLKINQSINLIC